MGQERGGAHGPRRRPVAGDDQLGPRHRIVLAGRAVASRVSLVCADVREVKKPKVDIACALNFSYYCVKRRDELLDYFRAVHAGLAKDGLFLLDLLGGTEAILEGSTDNDHGDFIYRWEQARFDALTHDFLCHIHFLFPDGSKLLEAFTYDWRLWMAPELRDLLLEAGFSGSTPTGRRPTPRARAPACSTSRTTSRTRRSGGPTSPPSADATCLNDHVQKDREAARQEVAEQPPKKPAKTPAKVGGQEDRRRSPRARGRRWPRAPTSSRSTSASVQSPGVDIEFFDAEFQKHRGRGAPLSVREDFCGTALFSAEWCKSDRARTALGVDLDGPTLGLGPRATPSPLAPLDAAERVTLAQADVRDTRLARGRPDRMAMNFSYCVFKTREELRGVLRRRAQEPGRRRCVRARGLRRHRERWSSSATNASCAAAT